MTEDLHVQWMAPVDVRDIQVMTTDTHVTRTSTLRFTRVRTSHGGEYTCQATTTLGNDLFNETLVVQSEKMYINVIA